jgi:hypothetical protein
VNFIPPYGPSFSDWQKRVSTEFGKLNTTVRSITIPSTDFGLTGDGSDETERLTAFFNSAIANPLVRHALEAKTYGVSAALPTINVGNVWIEGAGAEVHDIGTGITGTVIKWVGGTSTGTTLLKIEPASGASNQHISNIIFRGIGFDCVSGAIGTALSLKSVQESKIDVAGLDAYTQGVYLGVVSTLGEAKDLQNNDIRISWRQFFAPGYVLTCDGDSAANTSLNDFFVEAQIMDTPAIRCVISDNNRWKYIRIFKALAGTATSGMVLQGGADVNQRCRAEIIDQYTGNMPILVKGTGSYTVGSTGHVLRHLDHENGTPAPTVETAATIAVNNAEITYTPTVASATGTITTSSSAGKYVLMDGGVVLFTATATITTNGTGATALRIGLPFTSANDGITASASCIEITGSALNLYAELTNNSAYATILLSGGGYPGASGRVFTLSGWYKATIT